ncbi:MAG: hypothetical protein K9L62_00435 [Vallitaleaceae bacterium]|nr:hypothetical protein [Vallitaleaceae bacterium]
MAVKKSPTAKIADENEIVKAEPLPAKTESQAEKKNTVRTTSVKEPAGDTEGFCVYIGPSIRGVIQSGTIYGGSLEKTKAFLSPAIKKYPLIANLICTEKTFAEDRIKVKNAGNLLNVYYKKLATGKSN